MHIKINELLPSTIVTRDSIVSIKDFIVKHNQTHVVFDFEKIEFVSRAFADELLTMIDERNLSAKFLSVPESISEVFEVVKRNRSLKNRGYQNIPITKYTTQHQLENLLSLI